MGESGPFLGVTVLQFFFKMNGIDATARRVFENYQLVRNYAVDDFFLFGFAYIVDVTRFVQLGLASIVTLMTLKYLVYANSFVAAWVLILGTVGRGGHLDSRSLLMETAGAHFCDRIVFHASVTFDQL